MAKDFLKKEPTKNEKMLMEVAMQVSRLDHSLYSNSLHLLALGMALNITPEKMAEMLTQETKKLQEYGESINKAIEEIRKKNGDDKKAEPGHEGHDHSTPTA